MIKRTIFRIDAAGHIADHDPNDVLDYGFNYTGWLSESNNDAIALSTWAATPAGLTLGASTNNAGIVSVFVSGGAVDTVYTITNHITTAGGRQYDQSFRLRCKQR